MAVARAGMGTIAEISALKKPAILIPISNSAQEKNAEVLRDAARVLDQKETSSVVLLNEIRLILNNVETRERYSTRIGSVLRTNVADDIIKIIKQGYRVVG
jgi:UDP-N-acetylglucosamine:LPS N-acetylglucosamine transferase